MSKRSRDDAAAALDVGIRLRQLRASAGLTQEALSRAARLTPKFISQVENGHANPSIAVLARIVESGLQLPLAAFFAHDIDGGLRTDLATLAALLGGQPTAVRRRALRVLIALVADD